MVGVAGTDLLIPGMVLDLVVTDTWIKRQTRSYNVLVALSGRIEYELVIRLNLCASKNVCRLGVARPSTSKD